MNRSKAPPLPLLTTKAQAVQRMTADRSDTLVRLVGVINARIGSARDLPIVLTYEEMGGESQAVRITLADLLGKAGWRVRLAQPEVVQSPTHLE